MRDKDYSICLGRGGHVGCGSIQRCTICLDLRWMVISLTFACKANSLIFKWLSTFSMSVGAVEEQYVSATCASVSHLTSDQPHI